MMFRKRAAYFFFVVTFIVFSGDYQLKAQLPDYGKLAEYLKNLPIDRSTAPLITDHLERSGTDQPLEELVRWAGTGFPEFHDKNNIWHINVEGFHSNFEHALYYYITEYNSDERGSRYLRLIEELRKYAHFTYPLSESAYRFLSEDELRREFYRLLGLKDGDERRMAFILGLQLAEKDRAIAAIYFRSAREDPHLQTRADALGTIATLHSVYPRELALAGLERLLNDPEEHMKKFAGVIVRQSADFRSVWTEKDLSMLLTEMLRSKDAGTRQILAMTVAKMTTDDKTFYIDEKKWADHPEEKFIALINSRSAGSKPQDEEIVELWRSWWTPLIPEYMFKSIPTICRKK